MIQSYSSENGTMRDTQTHHADEAQAIQGLESLVDGRRLGQVLVVGHGIKGTNDAVGRLLLDGLVHSLLVLVFEKTLLITVDGSGQSSLLRVVDAQQERADGSIKNKETQEACQNNNEDRTPSVQSKRLQALDVGELGQRRVGIAVQDREDRILGDENDVIPVAAIRKTEAGLGNEEGVRLGVQRNGGVEGHQAILRVVVLDALVVVTHATHRG